MAKVKGGITGRPAGKVAELIFGAARTREGKAVTVREAVNPSNPRTAEQQAQRSKFSQALQVTKAIGPSIYQDDWNRSVGQLPGFQSWMSILLNNIDATDTLAAPADIQLGDLHYPDTVQATPGTQTGEIDVDWSSEAGANGTGADVAVAIAIEQSPDGQGVRQVVTSTAATRTDETATLQNLPTGSIFVVGLYFRGAGSAEGLLSLAGFYNATSAP